MDFHFYNRSYRIGFVERHDPHMPWFIRTVDGDRTLTVFGNVGIIGVR